MNDNAEKSLESYRSFQLLSDQQLRGRLAVQGRERAVVEHSWQSRGARLTALYRRMLAP